MHMENVYWTHNPELYMAVNVGKNIDIFKSRVSFLPIWDWGFVTIYEKSKLFYQL